MQKIFLFNALLLAAISQLPAQCLSQLSCPAFALSICDTTTNNPEFWNGPAFFDPAIASQDLGETPVDLSVQLTDSCGADDLQVSFLLRFDLNHDGVLETAISSLALPPADTIYFGNANNPNYTGGIARHFDSRPVPVNQKYGFVIEKTVTGNVVTVRLRWATAQQPGNYVLPQLPYGPGRIDWHFDQNGEAKTCGYVFVVKDCQAPEVTCLNGLSVNVLPTHFVQLSALDFLLDAQDNYAPNQYLKYGLRRSGTGTGFPVNSQGQPIDNLVFSCQELGIQPVELWARDAGGNADFCESYVIVQDNNLYCSSDPILSFCAKNHCDESGISGVMFELSGSSPAIPPFTLFMMTDSSGCISFNSAVFPIASNAVVTPVKDDHPLAGVTTLDLILISRHILGLDPLSTPYKLIAADANKSGSITTFDIVEFRKLILEVYPEMPNNTSWRFVDKLFTFPNPNNPFQSVFPENIALSVLQGNLNNDFLGIKIGDVNCTVQQPYSQHPQVALSIPDLNLQSGEVVEVPVSFALAHHYLGFQFGLRFDPALMQLQQVSPDIGGLENFGIFSDRLNVSVGIAASFAAEAPLFHLRIKA
ncbi:MAG: hypothetical protein ABIQ93_03030, partial [Saprospiraceae bacterium]